VRRRTSPKAAILQQMRTKPAFWTSVSAGMLMVILAVLAASYGDPIAESVMASHPNSASWDAGPGYVLVPMRDANACTGALRALLRGQPQVTLGGVSFRLEKTEPSHSSRGKWTSRTYVGSMGRTLAYVWVVRDVTHRCVCVIWRPRRITLAQRWEELCDKISTAVRDMYLALRRSVLP